MNRYDVAVVGAGHNGLVCASYLARAGRRVLVLEAGQAPGGLAAGREFHPGFRASVAHTVSHFSAKVVRQLDLRKHGFGHSSPNLKTIGLDRDGNHVVLDGDVLSSTAAADAEAFAGYRERMTRFANALQPFWLKTAPAIGSAGLAGSMRGVPPRAPRLKAPSMTFAHMGYRLRRLGKREMREFLRVATLPARDLMDECFQSDVVKATLSWDGLVGSRLAPRSPNGAVLAMLYRMGEASGGAHAVPAGGIDSLVGSLCAAARAAGADIRCGAAVRRILIGERHADGARNGSHPASDGLAVQGVELDSGERIEADCVVSSADPQRTFLDLVGVPFLDIGFTNRIRRLRCQGLVAKLHLALDGVPEFDGLESPDGRMIIAPGLDAMEFAFDAAKYGECPENPVMEMVVPSLHDPSLAPAGQQVLSAHVMYVPYRRKGGWSDTARHAARERAIDTIAQYAPRIRDQIVACEFLTPADIERECHVTGGHWHHTEFAIDQMLMMRPTYQAAQYRTPIPGLYLCGAGCHPGGDLTGAPGHNAAREILQ
ncbi:MAG: NAD(P)/FAD-dependent oxidoreductase [Gammaproteobacteria bacterium]|nr:NAD(P)/FAD-dependent oxidoreductase [Gammaproteobacteria bacterium]